MRPIGRSVEYILLIDRICVLRQQGLARLDLQGSIFGSSLETDTLLLKHFEPAQDVLDFACDQARESEDEPGCGTVYFRASDDQGKRGGENDDVQQADIDCSRCSAGARITLSQRYDVRTSQPPVHVAPPDVGVDLHVPQTQQVWVDQLH